MTTPIGRGLLHLIKGKMQRSKYAKCKVIERLFRKDRRYVRLESPEGKRITLPWGNYKWLLANPAFPGILKGYVIHHLDNDPMNDDRSNLVLMAKHHHRAYHLKHTNDTAPIKIDLGVEDDAVAVYGVPIRRPKIKRINRAGRSEKWRITYSVRTPHGVEQCQLHSRLLMRMCAGNAGVRALPVRE